MAGFCTNCGAPLAGPFCGKCGQPAQTPGTPAQAQPPRSPAQAPSAPAPAQAPRAPVQQQPVAQPVAAAKKGSGLGKVLLVLGGILVVFVCLGIAGVFYGVHVIKNKISTVTGGALGQSHEQVKVAEGNSCALLSKEELQQALGVTIEKSEEIMEGSQPGCAYYTNPAAFAQLQRMAMEQARKDAEAASKQMSNQKIDNPMELLKHTKEMEGIVKSFGLMQPDKEGQVFVFTVQRGYDPNYWSTVRATLSVVPGFEDLDGVGDKAMIGSFGHVLCVLKGNSVIQMDLMYVPEARTRGAEIGREIAGRL